MTLRGTLRSLNAAAKRAEREQRRKQRELERQIKLAAQEAESARARLEVLEYQNYIEVLKTLHIEVGETWDWEELAVSNPPQEPLKDKKFEQRAIQELESYKPNIVDKLLRRQEKVRGRLRLAIEDGRITDETIYQEALQAYKKEHEVWQTTQNAARKILDGDFAIYLEIIEELSPFSEIEEIGSRIEFHVLNKEVVKIILNVNSEKIVPKKQKSLLKSGKLSIKDLPKYKYYGIYQDYVSSAVLRVAREVFALLPISTAIITASTEMLNSATGHIEDQHILSVAVVRETLERINFEAIDPSDSLSNFVHNMKFMKTKGFSPVQEISEKPFLASE